MRVPTLQLRKHSFGVVLCICVHSYMCAMCMYISSKLLITPLMYIEHNEGKRWKE